MKTKKYNWLLKLCYVRDDRQYVISYVNVLDSTNKEVMNIVDEYRENLFDVRVYKLQPSF